MRQWLFGIAALVLSIIATFAFVVVAELKLESGNRQISLAYLGVLVIYALSVLSLRTALKRTS